MPFTAMASWAYKDAVTVTRMNDFKANDDYLLTGMIRAWVTFDGSAAALSAKANNNVSSITDSGAGLYNITFTTGFVNTGYLMFGSSFQPGVDGVWIGMRSGTVDTGSCGVTVLNACQTPSDNFTVGLGF